MSTRPVGGGDLLLVAVGGAAGALLRYAVDTAAPDVLLPWPTIAINVVGALALGLLPALAAVRRSTGLATALGPGLLGGFTTVSAWAGQVRELAAAGQVALAGLHLGLTLAAGLGAAAAGRRLPHRPAPEEAAR
ncbi:CrcB family protein [Nocardioides sp. SYSU D00065]|uniref:fluoride efflux transporter FluC n=1 Tax=Nocardioides sp. SYSU D00065 TaxID=2817378 RepID=UPI001B3435FA|nr:CrcB family protein [Nocardioides sp. SYSU D00065]